MRGYQGLALSTAISPYLNRNVSPSAFPGLAGMSPTRQQISAALFNSYLSANPLLNSNHINESPRNETRPQRPATDSHLGLFDGPKTESCLPSFPVFSAERLSRTHSADVMLPEGRTLLASSTDLHGALNLSKGPL